MQVRQTGGMALVLCNYCGKRKPGEDTRQLTFTHVPGRREPIVLVMCVDCLLDKAE